MGGSRNRLGISDGIDKAIEIEVGVIPQFGKNVLDRGSSHQLVSHKDTGIAEASRDLDLMWRGQGDAPSAVLKLKIEKGRTHRRLPVRGDAGVACAQEGFHPRAVVLQSAFF